MPLNWSELERWSFNYVARSRAGMLGFQHAKYPICRLGDHIEESMNGYCIQPVSHVTMQRMLRLSAIQDSGLDLADTKFVEVSDAIMQRFQLHKGDLLICRSVGSYQLVAKCAVVEKDASDVMFPDIMIRVRLKRGLIPAFVREVIQTPLGRSHFQSNARTTVGMWKIGANDIASFPIPLPPESVQRDIADHVATARAVIAKERVTAERLAEKVAAQVESLFLDKPRASRDHGL